MIKGFGFKTGRHAEPTSLSARKSGTLSTSRDKILTQSSCVLIEQLLLELMDKDIKNKTYIYCEKPQNGLNIQIPSAFLSYLEQARRFWHHLLYTY